MRLFRGINAQPAVLPPFRRDALFAAAHERLFLGMRPSASLAKVTSDKYLSICFWRPASSRLTWQCRCRGQVPAFTVHLLTLTGPCIVRIISQRFIFSGLLARLYPPRGPMELATNPAACNF